MSVNVPKPTTVMQCPDEECLTYYKLGTEKYCLMEHGDLPRQKLVKRKLYICTDCDEENGFATKEAYIRHKVSQ